MRVRGRSHSVDSDTDGSIGSVLESNRERDSGGELTAKREENERQFEVKKARGRGTEGREGGKSKLTDEAATRWFEHR